MAKVISFINEKGGVGKTTTTNIVASCLKHRGYKVLCVDFDPQGHLSFSFGVDTKVAPTIYSVLKHKTKARYAISHSDVTDIIPSDDMLKSIEGEFTFSGNEMLLKNALSAISPLYDYILIDSPPELGLISVNALVASDVVIIPCLPDGYSLRGTINVHETISRIKMAFNPTLVIGGILLLRFYPRENLSRSVTEVLEEVTNSLSIRVFDTKIRHSNVVSYATSVRQLDVCEHYAKNNAVVDYNSFVSELLEGGII